jgi:hypothetical protein
LVLLFTLGAVFSKSTKGQSVKVDHEEHSDHGKEKHDDHGEEKHDDHGDEKHEEHGEEKHEEEEENSKIGPDKGILKADEKLGFILSPEAMKNFGVKTIKLSGEKAWILPSKARVLSQNEVNIFRIRNQFIKRIDFKVLLSEGPNLKIESSDLMNGDEIIVQGIGFVRIAEITAFGGASEGHSH